MKIFLISLSVVSSLLMIVVILLQQGKGADLGAAFGRGAQGGLFDSAAGKANFLTRITKWLVVVFLFSSLSLSIYLGEENRSGVLQELQGEGAVIPEGDEAVILGSDADELEEGADLITGSDSDAAAEASDDDNVILGETPN